MTMQMLTIVQCVESGLAYLFVTVFLPAFLFHSKYKGRSLTQKLFMYFLTGNFYIMNLVFLLELLHISNRVTLIAGTILPFFLIKIKMSRVSIKFIWRRFADGVRRLSIGTIGIKTLWIRFYDTHKEKIKQGMKGFWHGFLKRIPDWICFAGLFAFLIWFYGYHMMRGFGYTASDIPVHTYWVNAMSENRIFVAGVYPFGFHCIIYYLHTVFAMDTYVLMRVFWLIQVLLVHLVLAGFLRLCCKNRYLCYAGVFFYAMCSCFSKDSYVRYYATLPQEFGMLFILPAIYFLLAYFKQKEIEIKEKQDHKESRRYLFFFAISFSMTLSVHFYGTMIAGLFCIAIAIGYLFWFVRPAYFREIMICGTLSVLTAVLPMAIAFFMGTPLQGSLGWGMNIINGVSEESTEAVDEREYGSFDENGEGSDMEFDSNGNRISVTGPGKDDTKSGMEEQMEEEKKSFQEWLENAWENGIDKEMSEWMFDEEQKDWYGEAVLEGACILILLGILFFFIGKHQYGAMLTSTGIVLLMLMVLMGASKIGIPPLMEPKRCCIYLSYLFVAGGVFLTDGFLNLLLWPRIFTAAKQVISLVLVAALIFFLYDTDRIREPGVVTTLQTNGAVTCLTNIIAEEKDFTWTILSAGDEFQMGIDHGYHYEINAFLKEQEKSYKNKNPEVYLPTPYVYIFIEKIPLDYSVEYEGSGRHVSARGAVRNFPPVSGNIMYKGENRWILMSKMYFWAQNFRKMFPNEMQVYFEDDQFVCYKLTQNPYRLFNLAIDYGYNKWDDSVN